MPDMKLDHIRCRTIIEVLGKPKEYVQESLNKYIEHIKEDSELVILNEHYSDIEEKESLFTGFVELELVIKGTKKLIGFCFEYMPSSIDILKPEHFAMSDRELSNFLNDLQARLHNVDMVVKKQKSENDFLKKNMQAIIHNSILICLKVNSFTAEQLSKITGIHIKELEIFLGNLLKENKIKKEKEIYSLA